MRSRTKHADRDRSTRRLRTLAFVAMLILVASAADLSYRAISAYENQSGSSNLLPSQNPIAGTNGYEVATSCSAVTTCTSGGIKVAAYASIYLFAAAASTTAPSGQSTTPSVTLTAANHESHTSADEAYVWYSDNLTAQASLTATVTFASATTYEILLVAVNSTATHSLDATGVAEYAGTSSTSISVAVTTLTADDLVLASVEMPNADTITWGAGETALQHMATSTTDSGWQAYEAKATAGSLTMSGTNSAKKPWAAVAVAIKYAGVPAAPTGLAAGTPTTTTIPLSWTKAAGPDVSFKVLQASYSGSCGSYSTSYTGIATSAYTVTGLTLGSAYCFEVEQANSTGFSSASAAITNVKTTGPPAAATGLSATAHAGSTTAIDLSWTPSPGQLGLVGGNETVYQWSGVSCSGTVTAYNLGDVLGSYSVQSLAAGTAYAFEVQEWNATGASPDSSCVSASTYGIPGTPTSLGYVGATTTSVALTWTQPTGTVNNDTVWVGTPVPTPSPYCSSPVQYSAGSVSTYTVTGLNPSTGYCFGVSAWNGGVEGATTAYLNVTTLTPVPPAPTNLASTGSTRTTVALSWTNNAPVTGSIVNVTVYVGTTCGTWTQQLSVGGAFASYTVTALSAGISYCFAVGSWDQGGEGVLSATIQVTTGNPLPGAPTLSAPSSSQTTVTLSWTFTFTGSYAIVNVTIIYRAGTCGGAGTLYISTAGNTTSWQVSGLTAFQSYCFFVLPWSSGGQGTSSNQVTAVSQSGTPPAPTNLVATATGGTWVNVVWANPLQYTIYNDSVYVGPNGGACGSGYTLASGWTSIHSLAGVGTAYNVTGLGLATSHCIEAVAWDGPSGLSAPLTISTGSGGGGGSNGSSGGGTGSIPPTKWWDPVSVQLPSSQLTLQQLIGIPLIIGGMIAAIVARKPRAGSIAAVVGFILMLVQF